jgi:hypothetical protein
MHGGFAASYVATPTPVAASSGTPIGGARGSGDLAGFGAGEEVGSYGTSQGASHQSS